MDNFTPMFNNSYPPLQHTDTNGSMSSSSSAQRQSPPTMNALSQSPDNVEPNSQVPRPKRIACVVCRRRKLRCDGARPSCATCSRLGHKCAYEEVRKKSGPKRGYVKQLEARLAQVETMLKTQDTTSPTTTQQTATTAPLPTAAASAPVAMTSMNAIAPPVSAPAFNDTGYTVDMSAQFADDMNFEVPDIDVPMDMPDLQPQFSAAEDVSIPAVAAGLNSGGISWEMISLGLEEPLPPQEMIDELTEAFFKICSPVIPVIHRARFMASMDLAPAARPPVCLRYAMWSYACAVTPKYQSLTEIFYQRARRYAELDEMKGFGQHIATVSHCVTWSLVGAHEFRQLYFCRAWASVGRASRLAMMLGLNRVDLEKAQVKQVLPEPRDWIEKEERRRAFWLAFSQDRVASVGTGWPMSIDIADVHSKLPSSQAAWEYNIPEDTITLQELKDGELPPNISSFGLSVALAHMYGRNVHTLHRPTLDESDGDIEGEFWKGFRSMDMTLANLSMTTPSYLRLPNAINDPMAIYTAFSMQAAIICLHQAAIFKVEMLQLPDSIGIESKKRCVAAATEITSIMRMICHIDFATLMPFTVFCLYIASRVFVQYIKVDNNNSIIHASLEFLIRAIRAMQPTNTLAGSFLVHLDVDIEASGIRKLSNKYPYLSNVLESVPDSVHQLQRQCQEYTDQINGNADDTNVSLNTPVSSVIETASDFPAGLPGLCASMSGGSSSSNMPTPSASSNKGSSQSSYTPPQQIDDFISNGGSSNPPKRTSIPTPTLNSTSLPTRAAMRDATERAFGPDSTSYVNATSMNTMQSLAGSCVYDKYTLHLATDRDDQQQQQQRQNQQSQQPHPLNTTQQQPSAQARAQAQHTPSQLATDPTSVWSNQSGTQGHGHGQGPAHPTRHPTSEYVIATTQFLPKTTNPTDVPAATATSAPPPPSLPALTPNMNFEEMVKEMHWESWDVDDTDAGVIFPPPVQNTKEAMRKSSGGGGGWV